MAVQNTLNGTTYCEDLVAGKFNPPSNCIDNDAIQSGADIDASKLEQHHAKSGWQAGAATDANICVHMVRGATATLKSFGAWCITPATGSATATVDLKKNGTTVLSAVITLDSSSVAYTVENATLSSTTAVVGDAFTVVVNATVAGTDTAPTDIGWELRLDEAYPA